MLTRIREAAVSQQCPSFLSEKQQCPSFLSTFNLFEDGNGGCHLKFVVTLNLLSRMETVGVTLNLFAAKIEKYPPCRLITSRLPPFLNPRHNSKNEFSGALLAVSSSNSKLKR
jgi:hypothetical protein